MSDEIISISGLRIASITGCISLSMNDTPVVARLISSPTASASPTAASARLAPPVNAAAAKLTAVITQPTILPMQPIVFCISSAFFTWA